MPKAFLLTNKRYKIWEKIKETFREEQKRRLIEDDFAEHFDNDDNKVVLPVDSSTDYSRYTDLTDDEDETKIVRSPSTSPLSSLSTSASSDDSDGGYSFTTENRPMSPSSMVYDSSCRQQHMSFLYDLMTNSSTVTKPTARCTDTVHTSYYQNNALHGDDFAQRRYIVPVHQLAKQTLQAVPASHQVFENHICPECGKRYSTSSNLARHRQTHRTTTDRKARKCPHCDKTYVSMPAYSMHVRTHSEGSECKYCGKRFSRPWLLQGHIRTHTGEKPFTCHVCQKAFADKSNLRAHIQTHSTVKPFICTRCGKAFALKSYLYKHEESSCMRGQKIKR